jgi:hypothetical protein
VRWRFTYRSSGKAQLKVTASFDGFCLSSPFIFSDLTGSYFSHRNNSVSRPGNSPYAASSLADDHPDSGGMESSLHRRRSGKLSESPLQSFATEIFALTLILEVVELRLESKSLLGLPIIWLRKLYLVFMATMPQLIGCVNLTRGDFVVDIFYCRGHLVLTHTNFFTGFLRSMLIHLRRLLRTFYLGFSIGTKTG